MTIAKVHRRTAPTAGRLFRLPLADPAPTATSCPVVVVNAGSNASGGGTFQDPSCFAGPQDGVLRLAADSSASDWHQTLECVLHHQGSERLARPDSAVRILVVGSDAELADAGSCIQAALDTARSDFPLQVLVLRWGGARATVVPVVGAVHFRLSRDYQGGCLSDQELVALGRHLLRPDLIAQLFEFAASERPQGEVLLGAAAGWLPEIPVARAVSLLLLSEFSELLGAARKAGTGRTRARPAAAASPSATTVPPLFHPASLSLLIRQVQAAIGRLPLQQQRPPGAAPSSAAATDQTATTTAQFVQAWSQGELQQILGTLHRQLSTAHQLLLAVDRLRATRVQVEEHAALLARGAAAQRQAAELPAAGEFRRPVATLGLQPLAWAAAWWRGRRQRERHPHSGQAGRQHLLLQSQHAALIQLAHGLRKWESSLHAVLDHPASEADELDRVLSPPFPNLVPIQSPRALGTLLSVLTDGLAQQQGQPPMEALWRSSLAELADGIAADTDPWSALQRAAGGLAASLPEASQPLGSLCGQLLPLCSPAREQARLRAAARPAESPDGGLPWVETAVVLSGGNRFGQLPAAIWFRWICG